MEKRGLSSELKKHVSTNFSEKQVFQDLIVFDVQVTYSFEIAFCLIIS